MHGRSVRDIRVNPVPERRPDVTFMGGFTGQLYLSNPRAPRDPMEASSATRFHTQLDNPNDCHFQIPHLA